MKSILKKCSLSKMIILSMIVGAIAGLIGGPFMGNIKFLGDVFFSLIQMSIIPLVMFQIIEAVGSLEKKQLGSTGLKAIIAFFVSSVLAAAFGILMARLFQPGLAVVNAAAPESTDTQATITTVQDTILAFVPNNIIHAMSEGSMVQVIIFSLFFGVALSAYRAHNKQSLIYSFTCEMNSVLLKIIHIVMYLSPIGIFAYVSATVGVMGSSSLFLLLKYLLVFGLAVLLFMIAWLIVVSVSAKMNVVTLVKKMLPMSVMALATTSSAVTLPLEMEDAKNKLGIGSSVANLVLPLGMPLNSNGAAMHMAITSITIAQMYDIDFALPDLIYVAIISTLLSLANAVVPSAALVSLTMIVPQLGLPMESIAIFAGVEWIVGMYRTILNVDSDVFCAILVAKSEDAIDYEIFNATTST